MIIHLTKAVLGVKFDSQVVFAKEEKGDIYRRPEVFRWNSNRFGAA